jgi:hypothetical protein
LNPAVHQDHRVGWDTRFRPGNSQG